MKSSAEQFAHVLLFACPACGRPLSSACLNTKKSLAEADAHWFNPHCHCGWTGDVVGITALQHWVQRWEIPAPSGTACPALATDLQLNEFFHPV